MSMRNCRIGLVLTAAMLAASLPTCYGAAAHGQPLPGTLPLTMEGDIASAMVDGIDAFLLKQLAESEQGRSAHWQRDTRSPEAYAASVESNRQRLAKILGVRDARTPFEAPELVATTSRPALVASGETYDVFAVRWPVLLGSHGATIHGEGLLLTPKAGPPLANVVAIPHADHTPEQIAGLVTGIPPASQYARRLAESGYRVLIPTLISRDRQQRSPAGRSGGANLTHREYIYRSAFVLGRHLIGYEIQKVLAAVDWFAKAAGEADPSIGIIGWGEGGMLALYAAALDTRIDAVCSSGYFGPREILWQQPLDRNVFGLLERFGDAELATLVWPRALIIENASYLEAEYAGEGGAPAVLVHPGSQAVQAEFDRIAKLVPPAAGKIARPSATLTNTKDKTMEPFLGTDTLTVFSAQLAAGSKGAAAAIQGQSSSKPPVIAVRNLPDDQARQQRQIRDLDGFNQELLADSADVRRDFLKGLDTSSPEQYAKTVEPYREIFRREVIGAFDMPRSAANPRSRKTYDHEKWAGYEVALDVFPGVFAYGVLLVPKDIKEGERRPVVVCQHGLEGRPEDTFLNDHRAYHDYAAKLCERGFITFAPQNPYIFGDRFRTLQRKANPLGKTLFSIIVPQHQQLVNWLKTLPMVDGQRIAFYGLSYGGKSAMRIPPLVPEYCLSICSADFNEWVAKNASTRLPFSYIWTKEYEIFEFDLGNTFNYAEMAALIAPRPFMVERGHTDGVSTDEWVAFEFAKVRNLYAHRLKLPNRCEIEFFDGPHAINGQGTFRFLHRHLNWPEPVDEE